MRMKTIGIVSALVAFACGDLGADEKPQPNRHRVHERPYTGSNFGLMRVNWDGPNPSLRLEVCGITGEVVLSRDLPFSGIQPN
jgi:hypothetical protein